MGVIATTVASTNLLQLHMAGNDEARTAAMQSSLAVIDAVFVSPENFPTDVSAGHRRCAPGAESAACDSYSLIMQPQAVPAMGRLDVAVLRLAPAAKRMPVLAENTAHSAVQYRVARFEVQVAYDASVEGGGRASVVQGGWVRWSQSSNPGGDIPGNWS